MQPNTRLVNHKNSSTKPRNETSLTLKTCKYVKGHSSCKTPSEALILKEKKQKPASVHDVWADKHYLPQTQDICQTIQTTGQSCWGVSAKRWQLLFLTDCKTPRWYSGSSRDFNLHWDKAQWRSSRDTVLAETMSKPGHPLYRKAPGTKPVCSPVNETALRRCQLPDAAPRAAQPFTAVHFSNDHGLESQSSFPLQRQQFFRNRWGNALCHLSESLKSLLLCPFEWSFQQLQCHHLHASLCWHSSSPMHPSSPQSSWERFLSSDQLVLIK